MLDPDYNEPRMPGGLRELAVRKGYGTMSSLRMARLAADIEEHDVFLHRLWPNLGPAMSTPFSWVAPHLTPCIARERKPAFTWAVLKTFFDTKHRADELDQDGNAHWEDVFLDHANLHIDARLSEEELVAKTLEMASAIRNRTPEERVTRSAIFREAPIVGKRRNRSRVRSAIEASIETPEQFERRRIRRGIERLIVEGRNLTVNGVRMATKAYSYDLIQQEIDGVLNGQNGGSATRTSLGVRT